MSDNCAFRRLTNIFKETLDLMEEMFDSGFEYCFCPDCHRARGDREHYTRRNPAAIYVLPLDYCRFGIRVKPPPGIRAIDVFDDWHVAYHGTDFEAIESIWQLGLRMPGETNLKGKIIVEKKGHFTDTDKPDGFDTKRIFVSLSPRYSGSNVYTTSKGYYDSKTKKTYSCRCIFQLRIKPGIYDIKPTTGRGIQGIDKYVKDEIIEWSTKNKNSDMLTRLLFTMTPKT